MFRHDFYSGKTMRKACQCPACHCWREGRANAIKKVLVSADIKIRTLLTENGKTDFAMPGTGILRIREEQL